MTFKELIDASISRVNRWHPGGVSDWSPLEWAGAMAGEAGEACNAAKKLKRLEDKIASINTETGRHYTEDSIARQAVGNEVADTIIYGVLLAQAVGVDLELAIINTFNLKSIQYGFPERIDLSPSDTVIGHSPLQTLDDSLVEQAADTFANQVSTERRVNCDLYIGSKSYNTVTAIVRAAFIAGAKSR